MRTCVYGASTSSQDTTDRPQVVIVPVDSHTRVESLFLKDLPNPNNNLIISGTLIITCKLLKAEKGSFVYMCL